MLNNTGLQISSELDQPNTLYMQYNDTVDGLDKEHY
jgi:hypothetical protein